MIRYRNILVALCSLSLLSTGLSKEYDNQGSLAISVNQDLPKGFDIDFLHELRSKENNTTLKKSFSELGLRYKISDYLSTGIAYRYSIYPDKYSERLSLSSVAKIKTGGFSHRYDLKYQKDMDSDDLPEHLIRHSYGVRHKLKWGLTPYIDHEIFTQTEKDKWEIVKHRTNIGFNKKLNSTTALKIYYRIQDEVNVKKPDSVRMIGLKFDIELK